jgi:hypothetical protein
VKEQIYRTVKEIFSGKKFDPADNYKLFFPSTSANYINSRKKGGAVGFLKEMIARQESSFSESLINLRAQYPGMEADYRGAGVDPLYVYDTSRLDDQFRRLYNRLASEATAEVPATKAVPLPEALKTRVITAGPPVLMTVLKPLQKFLWRTLYEHPSGTFCFTGRPQNARDVWTQLGSKLRHESLWTSVDYADATNNFMPWLSTFVVDAVCDETGLSDSQRELFHRALTGHLIEDVDGNLRPQKHG